MLNKILKLTGTVMMLLASLVTFNASAKVVEVDILKYKFIPQVITIAAGDTVRWLNKEKRQYHSVWFEQLDEEEPQYFFPDESYEKTFDKPGSFPYRCGPHPEMTGTVIVK